MQGRRITALLLTAFLVAQLLWRWQLGAIAPASTAGGSWSEVASGAYVAYGNLLLPWAQGQVLRHSGQGWVQARPTWTARWQNVQVDLFGQGPAQVAIARGPHGTEVLPRYAGGFLLQDPQQNLWLVQPGRVKLLLGGGQGRQSREAFLASARALRQQGAVPSGWQPVWAADPLAVGSSVWYLSNRDGQVGITPPHVFRLQGTDDGPIAALTPLGNLRLLAASGGAVLAADATGALLRIDQASGSVLERRKDLFVLAVGQGGGLLVLHASPAGPPRLEVTTNGLRSMLPLRLPSGVQATGPATFSMHGHWLALLGRTAQGTVLSVASLQNAEGPGQVQLIALPAGTRIDPAVPVSICQGVLYLTTRQGSRLQTWSRPIGGTSPLAFAGDLRGARHGSGHR